MVNEKDDTDAILYMRGGPCLPRFIQQTECVCMYGGISQRSMSRVEWLARAKSDGWLYIWTASSLSLSFPLFVTGACSF